MAAHDVAAFLADLHTSRDRAITLLMLLGGLRAAEVRSAYLREERPPRAGVECFVVLRGPTVGQPLTEAGQRRIFRTHRHSSGALRVRPHRLRHTYGTELAAAGIDLLVLRELMGHGMRFRPVRDPTTGTPPESCRADRPAQEGPSRSATPRFMQRYV